MQAIFHGVYHFRNIMNPKIELSIVVPIFEEESTVPVFMQRMIPILEKITSNFEIVFCMDPGSDNTQGVISKYIEKDKRIRLIVFSRRFGQPAATIAGIKCCLGDACVVIDVDLQDPPELIPELVKKWREGYDVVYAQRRTRKGETLMKRIVSCVGYKLINYLAEVPIPPNTGDFRLINRKVIESLRGLKETHGFLRGLVAYTGYKQTAVLYDRDPRLAGKSKYNRFTGSIKIGMNGIIAFSTRPLVLASLLGFAGAAFSILLGSMYILEKLFFDTKITPGIPTTVVVISFFASVQLITLGIMGEYIGRIYDEVRYRPQYMISEKINFPEE